jgi:hypothetical protein
MLVVCLFVQSTNKLPRSFKVVVLQKRWYVTEPQRIEPPKHAIAALPAPAAAAPRAVVTPAVVAPAPTAPRPAAAPAPPVHAATIPQQKVPVAPPVPAVAVPSEAKVPVAPPRPSLPARAAAAPAASPEPAPAPVAAKPKAVAPVAPAPAAAAAPSPKPAAAPVKPVLPSLSWSSLPFVTKVITHLYALAVFQLNVCVLYYSHCLGDRSPGACLARMPAVLAAHTKLTAVCFCCVLLFVL